MRASRLVVPSILITILFALLNHLKISNLNEPILVFDLYKVQASNLMLSYIGLGKLAIAVFAIAVIATLGARELLAFRRRGRAAFRVDRIQALAATGLCVFTALVALEGAGKISLFASDFAYRPFAQRAMAADYGYLLAEALNLKYLSVKTPELYGKDKIKQILASLSASPTHAAAAHRPNVVLILLESFRDYYGPEYHPAIHLKDDFIPFYHRLKTMAHTSNYLAKGFGGGTANSEYEVLTGMEMDFLPPGSVPYAQYIRHPVPSIVGLFARNGYRTTAMHSYTRTFWSRDQYKNIGFTDFFASEELSAELPPDDLSRDRLDDGVMFDKSIEMLRASGDQPQFQFLITLGPHGAYRWPGFGSMVRRGERPGRNPGGQ